MTQCYLGCVRRQYSSIPTHSWYLDSQQALNTTYLNENTGRRVCRPGCFDGSADLAKAVWVPGAFGAQNVSMLEAASLPTV